jgi:hypothetical protein
MKQLIVALCVLLVPIGGFVVKGCVKNTDTAAKVAPDIATAVSRSTDSLDSAFKNSLDTLKPGIKTSDSLIPITPSGVKGIQEETPLWVKEITESKLFKKLSDDGLAVCAQQEWRLETKDKIREHQWITDALLSENPEIEIETIIEEKLSDIFKTPLGAIGQFSIEANITHDGLTISLDTPCGSERYFKNSISITPNDVVEMLGPTKLQKDSIDKELFGKWYSSNISSASGLNWTVSVIGVDEYSENGVLISKLNTQYLDKKSSETFAMFDTTMNSSWHTDGESITSTINSYEISNLKSIGDYLKIDDVESMLGSLINKKMNGKIMALTSSGLVLADSTDGEITRFLKYSKSN